MILLHGDCLDLMAQIPDGQIDMVFADLPYGVTANKWDTVIPFEPLWEQLLRVGKKNCAFVFTATQPFATSLINSQPKLFRYDLIWEKTRVTGFLNAKRQPLRKHETVLIFNRKSCCYNPQKVVGKKWKKHADSKSSGSCYGIHVKTKREHDGVRFPVSVFRVEASDLVRGFFAKNALAKHPSQKPVALLEWLIKTYSNPGDVILDPTMGSGTTGVACKNTDRIFIGIEKDRTYYETACKRCEVDP